MSARTPSIETEMAGTAYNFQVGGSLRLDAPSYIHRRADDVLLKALLAGEYCYIFNARQMGKSSLRVRMQQQLSAAGKLCASVDMTSIGSEGVTPMQWYKGIMVDLLTKFELRNRVNFKQWWQDTGALSLIQRLRLFIEDILLRSLPDTELFIFVDEIDSALALDFPIDDFFALVRYCYNQRAEDAAYSRITWVLFGVATPSDLIYDRTRTPFNVGRAIELKGLQIEDAQSLSQGLTGYGYDATALIQAILTWTNGQPFLTQKICSLTAQTLATAPTAELPGTPARLIESIVNQQIIEHWESQDNPEHLRTIRDRLLRNQLKAPRLLGIYQTILTSSAPSCAIENQPQPSANGQSSPLTTQNSFDDEQRNLLSRSEISANRHELLAYDDSPEHVELLLSGLIKNHQGRLQVKNPIYQTIFDLSWVQQQLNNLRPYARQLSAWVNSEGTDESRLLRGKALKDAQAWSIERSVSEVDHDFLMASEQYDRRITQQILKSARLKEVEKRLNIERKARQRQRAFIAALGGALIVSIALGIAAFTQSQLAKKTELKAIITTSESLYSANQRLDALIEAIRADHFLHRLDTPPLAGTRSQMVTTLRVAAVGVVERNRLTLTNSNFWDVDVSATGQYWATASADGKVRIWLTDGELIAEIAAHATRVNTVSFFPDSWRIVSGGEDNHIQIWNLQGNLLHTLKGHIDTIHTVAVSPDGQRIASGSGDGLIKLWSANGKLIRTIEGHTGAVLDVAFSPDGRTLASASQDGTIRLWNLRGERINILYGHDRAVVSLDFSPDGKTLASASQDGTIIYWENGKPAHILEGHQGYVQAVAFSPDGGQLASASRDTTIRLWDLKGSPLTTLEGHKSRINALKFHPNGQQLVSAAFDKTVRLWDLTNPLRTEYIGPSEGIIGVDISPDGDYIAAASDDKSLYLWNRRTGRLLRRMQHPDSVLSAAFSPNGEFIVTGSWNGIARLWNLEGELVATFKGHNKTVWDAVFSPDGQTIATGGTDGRVRLWDLQGNQKQTIFGHTSEVRSVAFSADGQYVISASMDKTVKLWTVDGTLVKILRDDGRSSFIDANFSPDGKYIAAGGFDSTAKIWSTDGELLATLSGHDAEVRSVSFSQDSKQLLTASGDGTIQVWQLIQKSDGTLGAEPSAVLSGGDSAVWQAMFAEDDYFVLAAGEDKRSLIWKLDDVLQEDGLVAAGCQWAADFIKNSPTVEDRHLCDHHLDDD